MPTHAAQDLSRDGIVAAALALADEEGLDRVSMRAVANRVGVTAMALYPHVGGKDELLDELVGALLASLRPYPDRALAWDERLRRLGHAFRRQGAAHPAVVGLLFGRPAVTPDALAFVEELYAALLDAGVPEADVPRLERLVSTAVVGFAVSEASGRFGRGTATTAERRAAAPEGSLPLHERLAGVLDGPWDRTAEFERDLDDLIALVRTYADPLASE